MKRVILLGVFLILSSQVSAQNIIDHYSTIWPSGYGKMAFDGNTLYLNTMNGHAMERYDITDPANPDFIDREQVSGFEQIDFARRVMASENDGVISLVNFADFIHPQEVLRLDLASTGGGIVSWKMAGNAIYSVAPDDSIRAYDISDLNNPHLGSIAGLIRRNPYSQYSSCFGNSLFISYSINSNGYPDYFDVYDIRDPNDIQLAHTYSITFIPNEHCSLSPANGDTIAVSIYNSMSHGGVVNLSYFSLVDSLPSVLWSYGDYDPPPFIIGGDGGFVVSRHYPPLVFSYDNMRLLGLISALSNYQYAISNSNYFISSGTNSINVFQPTYSDSLMPEIYSNTPENYGILSAIALGDYVLTGVESNGGQLLIHTIGDDWDLFQSGTLPGVPAKDMIVDGNTMFCRCSNKIVALDITLQGSPTIRHELAGFDGDLVDFLKQDSLLLAITDHAYYVILYNVASGFSIIGSLDIQGGLLTGIAQYQSGSYLLKGSIGTIIKVETVTPSNPYVSEEKRLSQENYTNIEQFHNTLWTSGPRGTDVVSAYSGMDSVAFFGPEYFSDVRKIYLSNDTMYVADGVNGLKIFTFSGHPYSGLRYVGGYKTGNVVNQIARVERNFYISDYYSLQHLRWGAPDAIGENPIEQIPDGFTLEQNYPNPFNNETSISYTLAHDCDVTIDIFDIGGRKISTIFDGNQNAGSYRIVWSGTDLSSGIYFYRVTADGDSQIRKSILLK